MDFDPSETEGAIKQAPLIKLAETDREPHLWIDVNGQSTSFLVETGASLSTIRPTKSINLKPSTRTVTAVGFGGIRMSLPVSEPTDLSLLVLSQV